MSLINFFTNKIDKDLHTVPVHPLDGRRECDIDSSKGFRLDKGQWLDLTCGVPLDLLPDQGTISWFEDPKEVLGKGGFGVVVKGTYNPPPPSMAEMQQQLRRTNKRGGVVRVGPLEAAVKISRTHDLYGRPDWAFVRELCAVNLRHKNIVKVFGATTYLERNFVVMERALGSISKIFRYTPKEIIALSVVAQVSRGLAVLHANNIGHFDLKPDNVLVRSMDPLEVMITDFGCARDLRTKDSSGFFHGSPGTKGFSAPEVELHGEFDESADFWSLGVMGLVVIGGLNPFGPMQRPGGVCAADLDGLSGDFFAKQGARFGQVRKDIKDALLTLLGTQEQRQLKGRFVCDELAGILKRCLRGNRSAKRGMCVSNLKHKCSDSCQVVKLKPVEIGECVVMAEPVPPAPMKRASPVVPLMGSHGMNECGLVPPVATSHSASRTMSRPEGTTMVHTGAGYDHSVVVPGELGWRAPPGTRDQVEQAWQTYRDPSTLMVADYPDMPAVVAPESAVLGNKRPTVWTRFKGFFSKKRG